MPSALTRIYPVHQSRAQCPAKDLTPKMKETVDTHYSEVCVVQCVHIIYI